MIYSKLKYSRYLFILMMIVSLVGAGCQKDDNAPTPSEEASTSSDPRAKFVGSWSCNETSQVFGNSTYQVDINKHSTISTRIVVDNFYNLGFTASHGQVEVNGNNLTIIQQNISGYDIVGDGTWDNNTTISLNYITNDGSGNDTITAIYTKIN